MKKGRFISWSKVDALTSASHVLLCTAIIVGVEVYAQTLFPSCCQASLSALLAVHETPDVAATFLEKMFAKHVAASECKEGFLKSAVGTFFMGDQNYGFWGGFEDEDSKHDAAMLCVPVMYDQLLRAIDGIQQQYERRAFIILGNPGLGKSSFLVYKAVKSVSLASCCHVCLRLSC